MTKTEYREYIQSPAWQARRKEVLKQISCCTKCWIPRYLAQIAYDQDLHVHHVSYANVGNEQLGEIIPLCRRCHEIETFGRSDLREVKSHKCAHCKSPIFDPYSDNCDACTAILQEAYSRESLLLSRDIYGGLVWQYMLYCIGGTVGMEAILAALAEMEVQVKRDYEWFIERNRAA